MAAYQREKTMTERLVDVLDSRKTVVHTFPITLSGPDASTAAQYEDKALQAAAYAQIVPNDDLHGLTTRMHVSRGGALAPYGDDRDVMSQTKQDLEQAVRESAYFLWQGDGCPEGRADEYWQRADEQHLRERAYFLWQQEGCPEGRANEHWRLTRQFQAE
jgi:hypothetical protein